MFEIDPTAVEQEEEKAINAFPPLIEADPVPSYSEKDISFMSTMAAIADSSFGKRFGTQIENEEIQRTATAYNEMIRRGDKDAMLKNIAEKKTQESLKGIQTQIVDLMGQGNTPEVVGQLDDLVFLERTLRGEEADNPYIVEETIPSRISNQAMSDPVQMSVIEEDMLTPSERQIGLSFHEQLEEETQKRLILSQMLEEARADLEGNNIFEHVIDGVTAFVLTAGLAEARTDVAIKPDSVENIFNKGQNIRLLAGQFWNQMTVGQAREFAKELRVAAKGRSGFIWDNELRVYLSANKLVQNTERDDFMENVFLGVDGLFGAAVPIVGTTSYLRAAKNLRNVKLANKLSAAKIAQTGAEKAGEAVPSKGGALTDTIAVKDALNEVTPGIETVELAKAGKFSNEVMTELENLTTIRTAGLNSVRFAARLSEKELEKAVTQTEKYFAQRVGSDRIEDFTKIVSETDRNVVKIEAKIGKIDGGGFATERGAKDMAKKKKLNDAVVVKDEVSGQWFAHATIDLDASGAIKGRDLKELANTSLARFLLAGNRNVLSEELFTNARVAELAKVALQSDVIAPLMKRVTSLPMQSRQAIKDMLVRSEKEQKWFDGLSFEAEFLKLKARLPTDKERIAYYAAKELNDIDYLLRNRAERIQMSEIDGLREINIEAPGLIEGLHTQPGKLYQTKKPANELKNLPAFNATTGEHISDAALTQTKIEELFDDGYEAVRLREIAEIDGELHRIVFAKRGSITANNLPEFVVGYKPGGHRLYANKYWIKQAHYVTTADGTKKILQRPIVLANAATKQEAEEYAEGINRGIDIYKRFLAEEIDDTQATRLLDDTPFALKGDPLKAIERMVNAEDGPRATLNLETKASAVFDRADPPEMQQLLQGNALSFGDEANTVGVSGWYDTHGRAYFSRKGTDVVEDTQGKVSELLDPFDSMARALNNAVNHSVGVDLRIGEVKRWVREAEKVGFQNNAQLKGMSDMQKFIVGDVGNNVSNIDNPILRRNMHLKREKLRDLLNLETATAQKAKLLARNLAEAVEGKPIVGKLQKSFLDLQDNNPVAAMRSFAFDTKLGYFSPAQFFLQVQTSFALASLDPVGAAGHMGRAMAMRTAIINGNESMVTHLGKASKLTGTDPAEFAAMVDIVKRTRIAKVGNELALLDNFSHAMGADFWNSAANQYRRTRDAGRFVFFESERWNRLSAFSLAWKRMKEEFPDRDMLNLTEEMIDQLVLKTDDFSMNMTTAGTAFWQRGAMSVPAQFRGYPARMLEALLPEKFGGSKAFKTSDKVKLAMGQAILYGTAGLPMADYVAEQYFRNTQENLSPEMYKVMTSGLWDSLVFALTDGEVSTDFASRAGTGNFLGDVYKDLTEKGIMEFALGPSGAIAGDALNSLISIGQVIVAGGVPSANLGKAHVMQFLKNIETVDDASKALLLYNYGQVLNRSGDLIDQTENWRLLGAILTEAGFPQAKLHQVYELKKTMSFEQKEIKGIVNNIMMPVIIRAFEHPETHEQALADLQALAAGVLGPSPDPDKQRMLWNEITTRLEQSPALWDAISRYEKMLGSSQLTNSLVKQEAKEVLGE